jgi:hypothetical protein
MQIASPDARSGRLSAWAAAYPRHLFSGQHVLIGVIAGVTWLALIGGVLSDYIFSQGAAASRHSLPSYVAYNTLQAAPTSFGSLLVTRADLTTSADGVQLDVSLHVDNTRDTQVDAPRLEDLRLINTLGAQANVAIARWSGPAVLIPHSSGTVDLEFLAPRDAGLLWLEYRDPSGQWPIRVALGGAEPQGVPTGEASPRPAASARLGEPR